MRLESLADITREHRRTRPDSLALRFIDDGREWTFEALDLDACRCAHALRKLGVGPQTRIAYLGKNEPEYFIYLYGGAKLGAVSVPVNWRLSPKEAEYVINNSESEVLLIAEEFLGHLAEMDIGANHVVVIGDTADTGYPEFTQWIAGEDSDDIYVEIDSSDTCCQMYTSGTTGLPKGVETTNKNLIAFVDDNLSIMGFNDQSVNLICIPLFHIGGGGWAIAGNYHGSSSLLLREVDSQQILSSIKSYAATHVVAVPSLLQFLASVEDAGKHDYSSLEIVAYGASPISEEVLLAAMKLFNSGFIQMYGQTESTGGISLLMPEDHVPDGSKLHLLRSCGKVAVGHDIKIVDVNGSQLPEGETGEIWIKGPQVMKGYWRDPEATRETITADGWLKSGDAGYLKDGYLYIQDRIKDMIISGGENIYPAEVEKVLMKHDSIVDTAVIGVPSDRWGETVKAFVVRDREDLTEDDVIAFCRENLAHYKCPTSVDWLDQIPRSPAGKILKVQMREPFWEGKSRSVN